MFEKRPEPTPYVPGQIASIMNESEQIGPVEPQISEQIGSMAVAEYLTVAGKEINDKLQSLDLALNARPVEAEGNLANADHRLYGPHTVNEQEPLLANDLYGGNREEAISSIIRIGKDTTLAIGYDINHASKAIETVRVISLPLENVYEGKGATTIAEYNMADLAKQVINGVQQPWSKITIGRRMLAEKTGTIDEAVSGNHLSIVVDSEGRVSVKDENSTNGTQLITSKDFSKAALGQEGFKAFLGILNALVENDHVWIKEFADTTAKQ